MCASKVMQISKILPALLLSAIVTQTANCMDPRASISSEIDRIQSDKSSAACVITLCLTYSSTLACSSFL
jgi:hypothetical protein